MEHHPNGAISVEAKLDEVVSAAEGADLITRATFEVVDGAIEHPPFVEENSRRRRQGLLVAVEPDRDHLLDQASQRCQVRRQILGPEVGPARAHPAANIHADRGGRNGALHRDHAADGRSLSEVHVRHHGNVMEHPRQLRDVAELGQGLRLHLDRRRPQANLAGGLGGRNRVDAHGVVVSFSVVGSVFGAWHSSGWTQRSHRSFFMAVSST